MSAALGGFKVSEIGVLVYDMATTRMNRFEQIFSRVGWYVHKLRFLYFQAWVYQT